LVDELRTGPDAAAFSAVPRTVGSLVPIVDLHIRLGDALLCWFSIVSTIGTPVDIIAQELRLEAFCAADRTTEDTWRALVGRSGSAVARTSRRPIEIAPGSKTPGGITSGAGGIYLDSDGHRAREAGSERALTRVRPSDDGSTRCR